MGWILFALLNAIVVVAAMAVAVRARPAGRAELGVVAALLYFGTVTGSIFLLGWSNRLYHATLAVTVVVVSAALFAASFIGVERKAHLRAIEDAFVSQLRLPWDALVECWRSRTVALVGIAFAVVVIAWTAWISYLAPSAGWDGIWYHETITGYAIQNHGFAAVHVPTTLEFVNGFPKGCEMMNLWFVYFTDKTLIDAVHSFVSPAFMLTVYVIVRRFTQGRTGAMGWAAALFFMPGVVLELRSTYIDVNVALYALMAMHFCTRPVLRLRDALLASLALGLMLAAKGHALTWAPPLILIVLGRLAFRLRSDPRGVLLTILLGAVICAAYSAPTYWRNWSLHHNPVWPIAFHSKTLHVNWFGPTDVSELNIPMDTLIHEKLAPPVPGHDFPDTRVHGYGIAVPWVIIPLALLALPLLLFCAARELAGSRHERGAANALMIAVPAGIAAAVTPELWMARYNINVVLGAMVLVQWLLARWRAHLMSESIIGFTVIASMIMLYWADPRWTVTFKEGLQLGAMRKADRVKWIAAGYAIQPPATESRERDLDGAVVVYADDYEFPGLLWNEHYTNRIEYVPLTAPAEFLQHVDELGARWVVITATQPVFAELQKRPNWQEVGEVATNIHWTAFRRR